MRKIFTLLCFLLVAGFTVQAQQDPMFTKYMFNSLHYNPAYAGAKDHLAVGLLYRNQWWGIDGGPTSQTFTIHTPLKNKRVGVGLSAYNDVIGPTNQMGANISYAYRIPIGRGKLSVGLQAGTTNWRADWSQLNLADNQPDEAFAVMQPSYWLPNFGAGIYYYSRMFYVGFSSPHLLEYDLRAGATTEIWAKQYRHYYGTIGGAIRVRGDAIIFKPSLLFKSVGLLSGYSKDEAFQDVSAPMEMDIDLSLLFYEALWIGTSFRSSVEAFTDGTSSFDSVDIWAAYYLVNGLRIGAAYDYTLTKLQSAARGSFELMVGYEFNYKSKQIVTPRYF